MKHDGWEIRDDGVFPPMPSGTPPSGAPAAPPALSMVPVAATATLESKPVEKRKMDIIELGEDEEPQAKK
jgi:RNA exonuclease 1